MNTNATPVAPDLRVSHAAECRLTAQEWRKKAEKLWCLLDDISTYFDMLKPDMETFEHKVWKKCEERHQYLESDGYSLFPTTEQKEKP